MAELDGQSFPDATLPLRDDAVEELLEYLKFADPHAAGRGAMKEKLLKRAIPSGARGVLRSTLTALLRLSARRRITGLSSLDPLKLHLSGGFVYKQGWINLDLAPAKVDRLESGLGGFRSRMAPLMQFSTNTFRSI